MNVDAATRAGRRLFARYAYAPNARGYCGPPEAAALEAVACGAGDEVDVSALARRFSGAWPYHCLIAELAGIEDPLDERVGRAYWTGSALTATIDAERLGELLIERFAAQAGHYWSHLDRSLIGELTPTHIFHVLAVYPWSRLLTSGRPEPLTVLDSCRITAAEVLEVRGQRVLGRLRHLSWDGRELGLSAPVDEELSWRSDAGCFCPAAPGDRIAVHWGHVCDRLETQDADALEHWTAVQLQLTNRRLRADR